jgi:hypothetical protein
MSLPRDAIHVRKIYKIELNSPCVTHCEKKGDISPAIPGNVPYISPNSHHG